MQFYPIYEPTDPAELTACVETAAACRLMTRGKAGRLHCGIFNPVWEEGTICLHLNRSDEQIDDLQAEPRALVAFEDFLTNIPSYWIDPRYAGVATSYYRYAEFDCDAEVIRTEEALLKLFRDLMDRYQPEGGFAPFEGSLELYRKSLDALAVVRLRPRSVRTKWKLGQNRPSEIRRMVSAELRKRNRPNDLRAALEIEKWLERNER